MTKENWSVSNVVAHGGGKIACAICLEPNVLPTCRYHRTEEFGASSQFHKFLPMLLLPPLRVCLGLVWVDFLQVWSLAAVSATTPSSTNFLAHLGFNLQIKMTSDA